MKILSFALVFAVSVATAQVKPAVRVKVPAPANPAKFWLFLLAGQSNMAGRGAVEPVDTLANTHVLTLNKDGEWEQAKDPIHFDRDNAGVGPGLSFGKAMAEADTSVYIGLIPCAVGGSAISSWNPGEGQAESGKNFEQAVARCRKAMVNGTLKGIMWHQGETDCTPNGVVNYQEKLSNVISGFRKELNMPGIPFVAGQLPAFQKQQPDKNKQLQDNPYVDQINAAIAGLRGVAPNYNYVTVEGTDHRGDHLHFNSASARLVGKRYATVMKAMLNAHK